LEGFQETASHISKLLMVDSLKNESIGNHKALLIPSLRHGEKFNDHLLASKKMQKIARKAHLSKKKKKN
jgi:hypothetical protein